MSIQLTEYQIELLRVLWERGEATVQDIHESLAQKREVAPATIATMLNRMCNDKVMSRERVGRQFLYRALVAEDEVRRSMLGSVMNRLFGGDSGALLSHLVREQQLTTDDLEAARALLESKTQAKPTNFEQNQKPKTRKRRRSKS